MMYVHTQITRGWGWGWGGELSAVVGFKQTGLERGFKCTDWMCLISWGMQSQSEGAAWEKSNVQMVWNAYIIICIIEFWSQKRSRAVLMESTHEEDQTDDKQLLTCSCCFLHSIHVCLGSQQKSSEEGWNMIFMSTEHESFSWVLNLL